MSISDERELTDRLDQAFEAIGPRPAPVDQAMRKGRVIRARRRIAVVTGAAVVVAGVAVPLLLQQVATQPTLNRTAHHDATVHPAGPHAPAGLIASGTVDGRRWRVSADRPGTAGARRGSQCFTALSLQDCSPVTAPDRSHPVAFASVSNGASQASYGTVSAAVSYLTVRLADGTVLTLRPVSVYGTRFVAYAVPRPATISRITAYSARGELASAVPFDDPDGPAIVGLWQRPGQAGQRRATHLIGSGAAGGHVWSVTAYVGPWGDCLKVSGRGPTGSGCTPLSPAQGTFLLGSVSGSPEVVYGSASADVERMVITLAHGGVIRAPAVRAGSQKFFAFALGRGQHAVSWQAYDAAGLQTGSATIRGL